MILKAYLHVSFGFLSSPLNPAVLPIFPPETFFKNPLYVFKNEFVGHCFFILISVVLPNSRSIQDVLNSDGGRSHIVNDLNGCPLTRYDRSFH